MTLHEESPCPCCGFLVFAGPAGSFEICPVCDWEDDHVQLMHPSLRGGANRQSLFEAQNQVLPKYPITVRKCEQFSRDENWRPLEPAELIARPDIPVDGFSYFRATAEKPTYYWRERG